MTAKRFLISFIFLFGTGLCLAQRDLKYYIEQAVDNSPLIKDSRNQSEAARLEAERLKAFYTKAQVTVTANYLFSPIISRDNGKSDLVLNPTGAEKYTGYDLAASNGGLYQGLLNISQPLFNGVRYETAAQQALIGAQINQNNVLLTTHDLEKIITDQYILCLQDYKQTQYLNNLIRIIDDQKNIVSKLVENGIAKQSDLSLLNIEQKTQQTALNTFNATYRRDLIDLRVLCGISDTSYQVLEDIDLQVQEDVGISRFAEKYRLDSLNLIATQKAFELKYKPTVNAYANTGLNTVYAPTIPNRFGMSAGLSFTMLLFDGHQHRINEKKTEILIRSTQTYKSFFYNQNTVRKNRILTELKSVNERIALMEEQLREYQTLLDFYRQELMRGQISVINYVNTLKNIATLQRDYVLQQTNKQLLINMYNYWNW